MQYIQQAPYGEPVPPADPNANQWVNTDTNNQTIASIGAPLATVDDPASLANVPAAVSGDATANAAVPSSYNQKTSERMRLDEGTHPQNIQKKKIFTFGFHFV